MTVDEDTIILFFQSETYRKYMDYLTSRAETVLFGLLHSSGAALSWDQLMIAIQRTPEIREIISAVIWWALEESAAQPETAAPAGEDAKAPDGYLPFCRVLSDADLQHHITNSIHQTEQTHFKRMSRDKGPGYTWAAYLEDVEAHRDLLCELAGIYDARLRGIDFRRHWPAGAVADVRRLLCGVGVCPAAF